MQLHKTKSIGQTGQIGLMCLLVRHDDDDDDDGPQYGLTLSQWWNNNIPNCFIQCTEISDYVFDLMLHDHQLHLPDYFHFAF